jgi:hypothetical protein
VPNNIVVDAGTLQFGVIDQPLPKRMVPPHNGLPWPKLEYERVTIAGRDNAVGMPIYLLPIETPRGLLLVDETHGGTLTLDELPRFALTVIPGSATFPEGGKRGTVSVTLVHADKVPMVPNFGQQPRFVITIQPAGTHFNPPAAMTMPNVDGLAPGQKTEMYSFDHDLGTFVSIGPATVSEDGTVVQSDPGVGVVKGGWHCGGNPSVSGSAGDCSDCSKCNGAACESDPGENGKSCDDKKFCTVLDKCQAGVCSGEPPIYPDPESVTLSVRVQNVFGTFHEILEKMLGSTLPNIDAKIEGSVLVAQVCCEETQDTKEQRTWQGRATGEIRGEWPVSPIVPLPGNLARAGVFLEGRVITGGTANAKLNMCSDEVEGKVQLDGNLQGQLNARFSAAEVIEVRAGGKGEVVMAAVGTVNKTNIRFEPFTIGQRGVVLFLSVRFFDGTLESTVNWYLIPPGSIFAPGVDVPFSFF